MTTHNEPRLDFLFDRLVKKLDGKEGVRILDVGNLAGGGAVHQKLLELLPAAEIHGLDIVDQSTLGLSFAHQTIGSFEDMPFPDGFFDAVYIGEVIEHTWQPKGVLDRCYAILKKGGFVVLDTPNIYALSRMVRYMFTGKDVILGNPEHKLFFSRAMLEHILDSSGFHIDELTTEVNFVTKRLRFKLPNFLTFRYMGECLLVVAHK